MRCNSTTQMHFPLRVCQSCGLNLQVGPSGLAPHPVGVPANSLPDTAPAQQQLPPAQPGQTVVQQSLFAPTDAQMAHELGMLPAPSPVPPVASAPALVAPVLGKASGTLTEQHLMQQQMQQMQQQMHSMQQELQQLKPAEAQAAATGSPDTPSGPLGVEGSMVLQAGLVTEGARSALAPAMDAVMQAPANMLVERAASVHTVQSQARELSRTCMTRLRNPT